MLITYFNQLFKSLRLQSFDKCADVNVCKHLKREMACMHMIKLALLSSYLEGALYKFLNEWMNE